MVPVIAQVSSSVREAAPDGVLPKPDVKLKRPALRRGRNATHRSRTLAQPGDLTAATLDLPDDVGELFTRLYAAGMTDGLPVIPPTPARVAAMIAGATLPGDHVVAALAPRNGAATVEKIAVNAVMAGCLPAYFPLLIAAVRALAQPQFNLLGIQTTTNPVAPFVLVNGPIRKQIDVNCGAGALGPGRRANATIGRALRLILLNIGGGIPGEVDQAMLGMPGKYSFCFGELEEDSPWQPFHVERGFRPDDSTVTLISAQGTQSFAASFRQPESILMMLANGMTAYGTNSYTKGCGNPLVILPPAHAKIFHDAGWDKPRIRAWLFAHTQFPLAGLPAEPRLLDTSSRYRLDNDRLCICARPEDIVIIVAGGPQLNHVTYLANFGADLAIARIDP
jgi:hypothetical protein